MNKKLLSLPFIFWSAMFVIVPLCMVFYYGLTDKSGAFTLDNILAIATAEHSKALWEALKLSVISTVICLLLAYPLAMILCNMNVNQNSFLVLIFILPMWMNFLLRTLAWQTLLEKTGVINSILSTLHLPALNIINTPSAIVLGMVYNFLPFMVLPLYNVLVKIDKSVINAAYDLGANGVQTFVRIIFPLSLPGMFSGITMVFVPALTTFVISKNDTGFCTQNSCSAVCIEFFRIITCQNLDSCCTEQYTTCENTSFFCIEIFKNVCHNIISFVFIKFVYLLLYRPAIISQELFF